MNARLSVPLRVAAVTAMASVVGVMASLPATAESSAPSPGAVQVVNTETVQVYTDAVGAVDEQRIYEQLALTGKGTVEVRNPVDTDGLRNLDGFGGFDVQDGQQVARLTVDGEKRLRTVSDYNGKLPLDVKVEYFLDGKQVEPGDVVGESGKLEVKYTVKNVTAAAQELTFDDGKGGTVTKSVDVPIPMVGQLATVAPPSFTDVTSGEANMAGDGKGGTKLSFTLTLLQPIGSDTAQFGYTANITDGVIPRASIQVLPVNPLESPSFKTAGESYKGGAETGIALTDGASQIDTNLLKLRDGAGELLAGLIKLRDGADKLDAGLSGVAAPGAARLADGAGELRDGIGKIDDGAGKLSDGARRASNGAAKLAEGQAALADGLTTLHGAVETMPASVRSQLKANQDYQALLGALGAMVAGTGGPDALVNPLTRNPTLYGGLTSVREGLRTSKAADCAVAFQGEEPKTCGVADAVELVSGAFGASLTPKNRTNADIPALPAGIQVPLSDLQMLLVSANGAYDALTKLTSGVCPARISDPATPLLDQLLKLPPLAALGSPAAACRAAASSAYGYGAATDTPVPAFSGGGVIAKSTAAAGALTKVYQGIDAEMVPGLIAMQRGVSNGNAATCDRVSLDDRNPADDCGLTQALTIVKAGVPTLVDTLTANISAQLLAGLGSPTRGCEPGATLRCAADALGSGADDLSAGLGRLDDGAGKLADGTGRAADGSDQLADGAGKLATGLGEAADGSGKIADGLRKAAAGAPKLKDGAQRLSDEGTSKLVEAGRSTAQNYGEMYAVVEAGAKRAQAEKMVYGAPKGAMGLAAYSYEIKGEDGEGGRNMTRGLGGMAVLAAGAGAFALRRRLV